MIFLSRIGLDNNTFIILKSMSLSYLVILFPNFFYNITKLQSTNILTSKPFISFVVLTILIFSGFLNNYIALYSSYLYLILGFYLFISYLFLEIFKIRKFKLFFLILIYSIFFSLFITAAYYHNHYSHPLMIEKIMNGSFSHRDIFYHAAISGMFKSYNFIGTGLDGFVPHYYHVFSHLVMGLLSKMIGTNTLNFYTILYPIIITPIFFMFFIYSTLEVSKYFSEINYFKKITVDNIFLWFFLFIFFALPFSINYLPEKYQYLQSQSYTFGLILLFFIIYIFFYNINSTKDFFKHDIIYYLLPLLILIISICASYSKISFAYILTIIFSYIFLRLALYKKIYFIIIYTMWFSFLIYFWFNMVSLYDGRDINLEKFGTLQNISSYQVNLGNYTIIQEFFYSYMAILFVVLKIVSLKIFSFQNVIVNIKNNKIIDVEIVLLIALSLLIIPFQYFKGIQLYICYILILANLNLFSGLIFKR